jgi:two-component system, OmpR family, sensor histidine kinase CpxA
MKIFPSLLSKILFWLFLNLAVVAGVFIIFFTFWSPMDLNAIFGFQASDRMNAFARLISHDLNETDRRDWNDVLKRHAEIHQVEFVLILRDKTQFFSNPADIPAGVMNMAMGGFPPPFHGKHRMMQPPAHPNKYDPHRRMMIRTKNPTRYWLGALIPIFTPPSPKPEPAVLLAVSDSITGNGFFFEPLPWMIAAAAVIFISVLLWIPMVRNITRPLARLTQAAEQIARGHFDVRIREPRADEIGRLSGAINHMTFRLDGFVKGQKRFLSDVAHELGSPIARIQLGLGILEQRVDARNQDQVADVMEDVFHMSNLVNELLALSRAETGVAKARLENINLLPVVQRAVKRESGPETKTIIRIDPKTRVTADPELLTRAVANVVRNAVKYAADAGPIYISAERKKNEVELEIRDMGNGVPEDFLDQLFDPFFRPESSRERDSGGVGLGLSIVKTCIETCKGSVSVRNVRPKGFAVTITLCAD